MDLGLLYSGAVRKYQTEGIVGVIKSFSRFLRESISEGVAYDYQSAQRIDNRQRMNIIRQYISRKDSNLLDIGCAEGVLTEQISEMGLFCIGIERMEPRLAQAKKKEKYDNGLRFIDYSITPNNVQHIPIFDVVLLLTVYHHWCREYTQENAAEMLRQLARKSGKIIFEPPGNELPGQESSQKSQRKNQTNSEGWIVRYYMDYLNSIFEEEEVTIEHADTVDYMGDDRRDPIFVLYCNDY